MMSLAAFSSDIDESFLHELMDYLEQPSPDLMAKNVDWSFQQEFDFVEPMVKNMDCSFPQEFYNSQMVYCNEFDSSFQHIVSPDQSKANTPQNRKPRSPRNARIPSIPVPQNLIVPAPSQLYMATKFANYFANAFNTDISNLTRIVYPVIDISLFLQTLPGQDIEKRSPGGVVPWTKTVVNFAQFTAMHCKARDVAPDSTFALLSVDYIENANDEKDLTIYTINFKWCGTMIVPNAQPPMSRVPSLKNIHASSNQQMMLVRPLEHFLCQEAEFAGTLSMFRYNSNKIHKMEFIYEFVKGNE